MHGKRLLKWPVFLLVLVLVYISCSLASCVQTAPYRKAEPKTAESQIDSENKNTSEGCSIRVTTDLKLGLDDPPESDRILATQVESGCKDRQYQSIHAVDAESQSLFDYDALFLELDDQGLLNTANVSNRSDYSAWRDSENQLAQVRDYLTAHNNERLFIFTYVHGWKHNAAYDDANVVEFHRTLRKLKFSMSHCKELCNSNVLKNARVVGIYVGWRGDSLSGPDLWKDITFYERKAAAERVAGGAIRELFSLLHAYERKQNREPVPGYGTTSNPFGEKPVTGPCITAYQGSRCQVTTMIVGHSFGGLITFEALQGAFVDALMRASIEQEPCVKKDGNTDDNACTNNIDPPADLVVLINPAIEATRFAPIVQLVGDLYGRGFRFDKPALVLLTSTADTATSTWFPVGRALGTTLESTMNPEERDANLRTAGHMAAYVTHHLDNVPNDGNFAGPDNADCVANAMTRGNGSRCFYECPKNANKLTFLTDGDAGINIYTCPRVSIFKGAGLSVDPFALPVWNVQSTATVMSGHSDFEKGKLDVAVTSLMVQADLLPWPQRHGGDNQ
jgi:hypothetical protein